MEQTHQLVTNENILLQTLGTLTFFVFVLLLKTLSDVKIVYCKMCCQWLLWNQFDPDQNCFFFTGFDLSIEHPHTNVVKTCQLVKGKHLFWDLIVMSSVGKKSSRLSQNVVLDFCLLYKVKKDIWGRQRYITQIFTWLTYLVSFVLKLKVKCCIDKQAFRFFTEFSKLPLEKKILQLVKYIVIIWLMELFLFPGWATAPKDLAQTSYFLATNRLVFIMWYIHVSLETAGLIHVLFTYMNQKSPASDDHMIYTAWGNMNSLIYISY